MHKTEEGWKKRRVATVKNCAKGDRKDKVRLVKQRKKKYLKMANKRKGAPGDKSDINLGGHNHVK